MKTNLVSTVLVSVLIFVVVLLLPAQSFVQYATTLELPKGAKLRMGKGLVTNIAYSPDGTRFAVASSIGIWVYDTDTYQERFLLTAHESQVSTIAFSPDGQQLASGGWDMPLRVWDVNTGEQIYAIGEETGVDIVVFSPDGQTLATCGGDNSWSDNNWTIRLWHADTGEHIHTLGGYTGAVRSLSFSPDGQTLAGGSNNYTIRIWHVNTGEHIRTLLGHTGAVHRLCFRPDGQTLATSGKDRTLRFWDTKTGHIKATIAEYTSMFGLVYSPDGQTLASTHKEYIYLWDTKTYKRIHTLKGYEASTKRWYRSSVRSLSFSPDGQTLAGGSPDAIRMWDTKTHKRIRTLLGYTFPVRSLSFSPDGQTLAVSRNLEPMRLWNANTGELISTFSGNQHPISFYPDGHTLIGAVPGYLVWWDTNTGEQRLRRLIGHTYTPVGNWSIAFSPNRQILAIGSNDSRVRLWNTNTGEHLRTLTGHRKKIVESVAFSPDGKILASMASSGERTHFRRNGHNEELGETSLRLWEANTGEHIRTLTVPITDLIAKMAFSPNGKILASADSIIRLWHTDTGKLMHTLKGHESGVYSIVFNPNGAILASGMGDGTIQLWHVNTGQHLHTLKGHTHHVHSVAFSLPNWQTLASGSRDGTVLLWDLTLLAK